MLEPTEIHWYEPPAYRVLPPSPAAGPPPSLHFQAVILESPDARGGPPPALLHSLRDNGCRLILAQVTDVRRTESRQSAGPRQQDGYSAFQPTRLNHEWFDAVFDRVVEDTADLHRYLVTEAGMDPSQCLCYACTAEGAAIFADANVGLIIAPSFDKVWHTDAEGSICMPGADLATPQSPTARQLSWLHKVFTEKFWCVCLWWAPPRGELHNTQGPSGDAPSAEERAELTSVASRTIAARGHPPWSTQGRAEDAPPACTATLGAENLACPDWTPLEPWLQGRQGPPREISNFPKVLLYCHSLDVGIAMVNHALEAEDNDGLRVRVGSRRFVNLARPGQAAAELSVTLLENRGRPPPNIGIRSSLRQDHLPPGFAVGHTSVDTEGGRMLLTTLYYDESRGRTIEVKAWHRLVRDDGKGDVQLALGGPEGGMRTHVKQVGDCAIDVVFSNPRRGTRYTVEKVVSVTAHTPLALLKPPMMRTQSSAVLSDEDPFDEPPCLPEVEEEHRSAWRGEWDKADIEIEGTRKAVCCQRVARLFRYHQVSRGDVVGTGSGKVRVPRLVGALFQAAFREVFEDAECLRPSALLTSRVWVKDPRTPPTISVQTNLPPACRQLRFNAALGRRWHRFTFTSGAVKVLVQGPLLTNALVELHGDIIQEAPKFTIPSIESDEGVEVKASPWHEVHVQHALTELGRPDGNTGGFYSLMRRTRFMRMEVLRRLLTDTDEDYQDGTLRQMLRNALAGLKSVPRPPDWSKKDNEDLHILEADAITRARVMLSYEKNELLRDIRFLEGSFTECEGHLVAGEDISEATMTLDAAKEACVTMAGCRGFTFQGDPREGPVKVHFKDAWGQPQAEPRWASFRYNEGEAALEELLQSQHETRWCSPERVTEWVEPQVPSWDESIRRAEKVLRTVGEADADARAKHFRNFITDRDGTTNNYCDRYASSVQSAYNGAWLSHFARHCADNAVIITAAPLGGRPSAEGLMELCVAPRGFFTYTGSKGREYFNHSTQRVLQVEELPQDQRELIDELHRRLLALCLERGNTKFLGIGSGLQRKFGEVTMARNDPANTVPEPESRRFMAAVRRIKEELDPDGTQLDLHDTGTDMELFPHGVGSRTFDKGSGVVCLEQKLQLQVAEGPNLICGDTSSDVPMIVAALRLMCGDHMVDIWLERIRKEEEPAPPPEPLMNPTEAEGGEEAADETQEEQEQRLREEEERRAKEEEDELRAREHGAKLAVLFVVPPVEPGSLPDEIVKRRKLAAKLHKWCELSGAHCAILPSPDALVAALAHYANKVAGRSVTCPAPKALEEKARANSIESIDPSPRTFDLAPRASSKEPGHQRRHLLLADAATAG